MSVWELSVRGDVKQKLDEDFDKRTKKPDLSVDPRRVTYVAVTARSVGDKQKQNWAKEKKKKGVWGDVRVYDVDDLATWLEQAPAVGMWFGRTELGRPMHEVRTIEDFLDEFSRSSQPSLSPSIFLSGEKRAQQARELLQALVKTDEGLRRMSKQRPLPMRLWRIGAESAEEALLFITATLSMPGDEAASLRERTLIVETQEAFRYYLHAQSLEPLVIVPRFAHALPGKTAGPRVQAVLPVSWKEEIGPGEGLKLDLIPYAPLERALAAAKFADPARLARDADGRWSKLRVLLMGTSHGQRISDISAEQMALLLVGAWKPTQEADRAVMRKLGAEPDRAERLSAALAQGDEPMLEAQEDDREGMIYRVAAPRASWKQLGKDVTESDLHRFFQVAQEVLAPLSAPPTGDDWTTPRTRVESEIGTPSGIMREGVAASIAWLAVADDEGYLEPTHRRGRGSELASVLVSRLLTPDWYAWWSHSTIVRDLAEASPAAFFECLFDSLKQGAEGLGALFSGRTGRMIPVGLLWHPGHGVSNELLWALETLAWSTEWLPQVILALAALDGHDKLPERHSNRPFRSLCEILHPMLPQSKTTVAKRIELLGVLFERHEDVAWRLTITLVNELRGGGMLIPTPRPHYRRWVDASEQTRVTYGEIAQYSEGMLDLLLAHAAEDPTRWAALVDLPHHVIGWRVMDALHEAYPRLVQNDPDAVLWNAVRNQLMHTSWTAQHTQNAPNDVGEKLDEEQRRFRDLYQHAHTPSDFVLRSRWLFDGNDDLPEPVPGGPKAYTEAKDNLRRNAIEELG
ncbi:MAG TPA: hypothetical protein PK156_48865, partial [Polyangium sp.]|nr:hypothetical protein [Polyangium sp.]